LAEGLVDETLRLSEHFLPIMCEDTGLTPWAVQEICGSIYEMRAGRALENRSLDQMGIEQLTADLRQDVGDYIHEDLARVQVSPGLSFLLSGFLKNLSRFLQPVLVLGGRDRAFGGLARAGSLS